MYQNEKQNMHMYTVISNRYMLCASLGNQDSLTDSVVMYNLTFM